MGNNFTDSKSIYQDKTIWKVLIVRLNYKVIKNTLTNQELEQYLISLDDQITNINHQIRLYEERKTIHEYIVQCMDYFKENNDVFCKGFEKYYVITQRINRFNSFTRFDQNKALSLLQQSLIAYGHVLKRFGNFNINSSMIGINKYGRIKIWINQNFGQNHISKQGNQNFSEEQNIYRIHKMISDMVKSQQFKNIFKFCNLKLNIQIAIAYLNNYNIQLKKKINNSILTYKSRLGSHCQLKFNYSNNNSFNQLNTRTSVKKCLPDKQYYIPTAYKQMNRQTFHFFDNSQIFKKSTSISMNPTNTNTYTNSNISNGLGYVNQSLKQVDQHRYDKQSNKKNQSYKSTPMINSKNINIQSKNQEFSKLSLHNKPYQKDNNEIQKQKQLKLQNIAKIDSIIVIENEQDYLKNDEYTNELGNNVLLIESTILRS